MKLGQWLPGNSNYHIMNRLESLGKMHADPRWFIWTVVFLIVSGVSLVSYIFITTSDDANTSFYGPIRHVKVQAVNK